MEIEITIVVDPRPLKRAVREVQEKLDGLAGRKSPPEELTLPLGDNVALVRARLEEYGQEYELIKPADDPHDWIARWKDGRETRVYVP